MFPPFEPLIATASLTISADGKYFLQYRISTGQVIASLLTYSESDIRQDYEMTKQLEPQMVPLAVFDHRPKRLRSTLEWYK